MQITVTEIIKPTNCRYLPDKTSAPARRLRKQSADLYRRIRRDNPAIARLLYHQTLEFERRFADLVMGGVRA